MFTGIIEGVGKVKTILCGRDDMSLTIMPAFEMTDLRVGESISVDGVCLTVTEIFRGAFRADVSGETLSRSTLNMLRQGNEVNLERALRLMDRLGGHLVSGHVDGVGKILKKEQQQRSWFLRIGIDQQVSRYTIEKGSIAVDGISLTINGCGGGFFEVNVIPLTGMETTILKKNTGDLVNIETDLIGKYVEKFILNKRSIQESGKDSGIDLEMLIKSGFGE
ncbi:MAG: riboflavin synthase [Thermodesulfobacteriota bacterium]|nr:riboflavin synthase [Thermodesulfobacteriota bacterium]